MPERIPRWIKLLLWGLGVSLLLHGVALDLLRLPGLNVTGERRLPMQVTIEAEPEVKRDVVRDMPIALPASSVDGAGQRTVPVAVSAAEPGRGVLPVPAGGLQPQLAVGLDGVRSGSLDEALIALRLALVTRLRGHAAWPAMTGMRNWSLSFDAAGNVVGVGGDDLPPGLHKDLTSLAGALPLPDVLRGRAFELVLSVE